MKRSLVLISLLCLPLLVNAILNERPNRVFNKPTDGPLVQLHRFQPKDSSEAFSFHRQILQQRIVRVQQAEFLSDDKKIELVAKLNDELDWFEAKQTALESATTEAEQQAIRQEIIDHIRTARQEREQTLAQQVTLPQQSPVDTAKQITERFQTIAERFNNAELDATIEQYTAAVANLEQTLTDLEQDKTIEHIRALRDAITITRQSAQSVRNLIQSLVVEQHSLKNN